MKNKQTDLFEYKFEKLPDGLRGDTLKEFKKFLDKVWQKYKEEKPSYWRENLYDNETDEDIKKNQPFLFFDEERVKSRNYIGYIKFKEYKFNLYPKICSPQDSTENINYKKINDMLRLWLEYSNNAILPKIETGLNEARDCDFIEILIYLFAKYTSDLLSISIFQHYEEINEETNFLKGKLNFNEYIRNCTCGKSHKFHCTYDSFEVNNKFNQIIKYVSKCLYEISNNNDNRNYLIDILHTLDEVDDVICTYNDCKSVYINRFMGDFNTVLDYCKLFLINSITFNESGEFDNFAFLLRTEVLFEDFISNFAEKNFPKLKIKAQSQKDLDTKGKLHYRPDLIVEYEKNKIIIDIKYKDISNINQISYSDIYQCITYAIKEKCENIILLYPDFNKKKGLSPISIDTSEFCDRKDAKISISFCFVNCCDGNNTEEIEKNLKEELEKIFINFLCPKMTQARSILKM